MAPRLGLALVSDKSVPVAGCRECFARGLACKAADDRANCRPTQNRSRAGGVRLHVRRRRRGDAGVEGIGVHGPQQLRGTGPLSASQLRPGTIVVPLLVAGRNCEQPSPSFPGRQRGVCHWRQTAKGLSVADRGGTAEDEQERAARRAQAAHGLYCSSAGSRPPQRIAVVDVGVAAGDQQGAEADHLGKRVARGRRIARVLDASRQTPGDGQTPFDLGRRQHTAIPGQPAAIKGRPRRPATGAAGEPAKGRLSTVMAGGHCVAARWSRLDSAIMYVFDKMNCARSAVQPT